MDLNMATRLASQLSFLNKESELSASAFERFCLKLECRGCEGVGTI